MLPKHEIFDLVIIAVGLQLFVFYFINKRKKGNDFHTSRNNYYFVCELSYVTCQTTKHVSGARLETKPLSVDELS